MSEVPQYQTPQEAFWAGEFGTAYIGRNSSVQLIASNVRFFSVVLKAAGALRSCLELGANVGMNLKALKGLYREIAAKGVEINPEAARLLGQLITPEAPGTRGRSSTTKSRKNSIWCS